MFPRRTTGARVLRVLTKRNIVPRIAIKGRFIAPLGDFFARAHAIKRLAKGHFQETKPTFADIASDIQKGRGDYVNVVLGDSYLSYQDFFQYHVFVTTFV